MNLEEKKSLLEDFNSFKDRVNSPSLEFFRRNFFKGKIKRILTEPIFLNEFEPLSVKFASTSIADVSVKIMVSNGFSVSPSTVNGKHDSITYTIEGVDKNLSYISETQETCIKNLSEFIDNFNREIEKEESELKNLEEEEEISPELLEKRIASLKEEIESLEVKRGKLKEAVNDGQKALIRIINSVEDSTEFKKEVYKELL